MRGRKRLIVGVMMAGALGACAEGGVEPREAGIALQIAQLELPGVDMVCYDVAVAGAAGAVWSQGEVGRSWKDGDRSTVCSTVYGSASGGVAYVGPCDASLGADVDAHKAGVQNDVTLWFDGLYSRADGDDFAPLASAWADPCGADGCRVAFDCAANRDTPVALNFTVMREASRGFFDIVVGIESVACAAKVDCRYANETEDIDDDAVIRLVRDLSGVKQPTAVFAVTCMGGASEDAERVRLYLADVRVRCEGEAEDVVVPVGVAGPVYDADQPPPAGGIVAQALVTLGAENLVPEDVTPDEVYWSVALGLGASGGSELAPSFAQRGCVLRGEVSAARGDVAVALARANTTYPVMEIEVPLTSATGELACARHPLSGGNGVAIAYGVLGAGLPATIQWEVKQEGRDGAVVVTPYTP